ncbi:hypothetical protein [Leucobacter luti]|uniref:Uncharacterized protein n=1 Tax=Leucobacter luti TaxID=340320 RepID=A0A4R6RSH1_9MICO|nr:hypothetical protein [Leucobacter luti]QYM77475.1 hypothetical protein K1X41_06080 [Leucobacter luti]TDP89813.1 hypothetical protein EDF62_3111 [Leucobacter luti]
MGDYVSTGMFWGTLALINAGLAEQKGRSRLNWFLLSLVFGPIATALIVVWERPDSPHETYGDAWARSWSRRNAKRARKRSGAETR